MGGRGRGTSCQPDSSILQVKKGIVHDANQRMDGGDRNQMIENHMVIPGTDHPAYAEDQEDDGDRDDRLYDRWVEEQDATS